MICSTRRGSPLCCATVRPHPSKFQYEVLLNMVSCHRVIQLRHPRATKLAHAVLVDHTWHPPQDPWCQGHRHHGAWYQLNCLARQAAQQVPAGRSPRAWDQLMAHLIGLDCHHVITHLKSVKYTLLLLTSFVTLHPL